LRVTALVMPSEHHSAQSIMEGNESAIRSDAR
jgi:hypothetical protein